MTEQTQPARQVSALWFTPYAWAKLLHMCHWTPNEVGAMGLANAEDPFLIEDLWIPKQEVDLGSTKFDMDDFAVTQLAMADPDSPNARHPRCFRRVWIHTHPEGVHQPSNMDERTFKAIVGRADWGVMFILAKDGKTYCRMRARAGDLEVDQELEVCIAWGADFPAASQAAWVAELTANVTKRPVYEFVPAAPPVLRTTNKLVANPRVVKPAPVQKNQVVTNGGGGGQLMLPGVKPRRTARNLRVLAHNESILNGISGRQMNQMLTDDIQVRALTTATIALLDKAGVTVVNKSVTPAKPDEVATFTHKSLPEPVTSTGLLNIDRLQIAETLVMSELDWYALEDDLIAITGERVIGIAGHTDSYDEPLEAAYPWLAYDGTTLLLSERELTALLDDLTGEFINEGDSRDMPIGFHHEEESVRQPVTRSYLTLQEQDERDQQKARETLAQALNRLSEQPVRGLNLDLLERATKHVITLLENARADGLTVDSIEAALTLLAAKAAAEGWLPEAVFKIKELRNKGYSLVTPAPAPKTEEQTVNELLLEQYPASQLGDF